MSLQVQITALAQAIAADIKALYLQDGTLSALNTTAKGNLVSAINEVRTAALAAASGVTINDTTPSGTTTYSSNEIVTLIAALKTQILGGASTAYDTLVEIQTILQGDDTSIGNLLTAVGNRVQFDASQTLTVAQQLQACTNIGVGDPSTNFITAYAAAKV
jgi:capsid protein